MKKFLQKLAIVASTAALFLVVAAGPAAAGDFGVRTFTWPAHDCNGNGGYNVQLDVHTSFPSRVEGEMFMGGGGGSGCPASAHDVDIDFIKLWGWTASRGYFVVVQDLSNQNFVVANSYAIASSNSYACYDNISYHTEANYKVNWKDGTSTAWRDNNSYVYTGC